MVDLFLNGATDFSMKDLGMLRRFWCRLRQVWSEQGPYRFVISPWEQVNDLDLAARVLDTEYFRSQLQPRELPVSEIKSMMVFAPHQDDEVIGAGGLLLKARNAGVAIDIVYVTDGEARNPLYAESTCESIEVRFNEARQVCDQLNARLHRLGISNLNPNPTRVDVLRVFDIVKEKKPQVILVPWLLDSPPKHRMVNHLIWLARQIGNMEVSECWGYQVHNSLLPNAYVDITDVARAKEALIRCYKSQIDYYQRYDHIAMGLAAWNSRFLKEEARRRYVEIYMAIPEHEHFELMKRFYFRNLKETYKHNEKLVLAMSRLHALCQEKVH